MAAGTAFKPISMAEGLVPTALSSSKPSLALLSLARSSKPFPFLRFSRSFSSLSLKKKLPFLPLVASTSGWARQEDLEEGEDGGFDLEGIEDGAQEDAGVGVLEWDGGEEQKAEGGIVDEEDGEFAGGEGEEEEEPYAEPPEDAKLFVGNLPYDIDSEQLGRLFEQAGIVEIAEVIYNRETDQSRGFGFVTFSTVEEAEKAVEKFNRYDIDGRLLVVNKAAPKGSRVERPQEFEPAFRVYVGNLPWTVDDVRLEQIFSEHGKVLEARVVYDRETGRSRGFGFVKMASQAEMDDAIASLDGQNLDGRALRVNVAEARARRTVF